MARRQLEQALQASVAEFPSWTLSRDVYWTAIGHGGGGPVRGAILKACGLRAGTPDLMLLHDGRAYFIELKTMTGRLSDAQRQAHADLERAGATVAVARSIDEVADQLHEWRIPTKARAA